MKTTIRVIFQYFLRRKRPAVSILILATQALRRLLEEEERAEKNKPIYPVF